MAPSPFCQSPPYSPPRLPAFSLRAGLGSPLPLHPVPTSAPFLLSSLFSPGLTERTAGFEPATLTLAM